MKRIEAQPEAEMVGKNILLEENVLGNNPADESALSRWSCRDLRSGTKSLPHRARCARAEMNAALPDEAARREGSAGESIETPRSLRNSWRAGNPLRVHAALNPALPHRNVRGRRSTEHSTRTGNPTAHSRRGMKPASAQATHAPAEAANALRVHWQGTQQNRQTHDACLGLHAAPCSCDEYNAIRVAKHLAQIPLRARGIDLPSCRSLICRNR